MNKSSFKSRNNAGNMQRSNIGTVGMMRQQHSQQNNNMQQQSNMNQQHTNMQQMNQQQYNQQQYYQQQQLAQHHQQQQQQQYNSQQHGGPQQGSVGMQHRGGVGMQHPHQQQMGGGQQGGMQQQQMNNGQQQNVVQQLNQKNHRLAKELVRLLFFNVSLCFCYESLLWYKGVSNKEYLNRWIDGFNIDFYIVFVDILGWLGCNVVC